MKLAKSRRGVPYNTAPANATKPRLSIGWLTGLGRPKSHGAICKHAKVAPIRNQSISRSLGWKRTD